MKRDNPKIDAFLKEIVELSKRYGFSLAHEDRHGAFTVEQFDQDNIDWLNAAYDETNP